MAHWPRNENNDAYWAGFMKVVKEVEKTNKYSSVHPAFNEMCAPTVDEALNEALKTNPDEILITSIMVTPGGGHSEHDIPKTIEAFKKKNPSIKVVYAWPYDPADISNMLIGQLNKYSKAE
jgi:sirohydrochlorin cobaltochelatase